MAQAPWSRDGCAMPPRPLAMHPRWLRDASATARDASAMATRCLRDRSRCIRDGYAMPPCLKPRNSAEKLNNIQSKPVPVPVPGGRLGSVPMRQRKLATDAARGAGGTAPAGVRGSPPVSKNVGGQSGRDSGVRAISPPSLPQAGCRGAAPAGGTGGVPLYPKTLEGGQVGQRRRPCQSPR